MKILIFSVAYHPFVGGAEIAVKEITDRISDIEFHLVTVNLDGKQKREEKIGNIYVYRIGQGGRVGKLLFTVFGFLKGLSLHKKEKFDATWSILAGYSGFAALFFKYAKPKVPFILTLQEGDPISYIKRQVWFVYPLFVQIFRKADRIQTISNYLADFARSMGTKATITVIPNGVDVSLFSQVFTGSELENFKDKIGKKLGDVFLVTSSRLVLKNAVDDIISSLKYLPANIKLLILGTGELEGKLRNISRKLRVADRVKFLGFVSHKELPKYLKASDVFIRPSLSEGMGNSFIESMAAGTPVIATQLGGIPDFIRDSETGFFCEVKNPESIAEKVTEILENNELRARVVKNAHGLATEQYNWDLVAGRMKEEVFRL